MSAINTIKMNDALYLATDSVMWSPDGVVCGFVPKSFAIPHFPAVIATRGAAIASFLFGWTLSMRYRDFDDMVSRLEDDMPEIHERIAPELGEHNGFDLVIAGYSTARQSLEVYYMTTMTLADRGYSEEQAADAVAAGVQDCASYALHAINEALCTSPAILSEEEIAETGLNQRVSGLGRREQIDETFRTILELQRAKPFNFGDCDESFHGIGGWATCVTVTKDGVEEHVFHRWPEDKIGEFIQPRPLDWGTSNVIQIATPPAGMNRQQRRAWERQQKKAKK